MATAHNHIFWLLIVSILCVGASVVLAYMSKRGAAPLAFAALLTAYFSHYTTYLPPSSLWFWGAATLIIVGIDILLPPMVRDSQVGVPYMATGALAGVFVGMLTNTIAGVIIGSAAGVAIAAIAFSRLRAGKVLGFPSRKFFNYLCTKGLPLVVTFSMIGLLTLQLIIAGVSI